MKAPKPKVITKCTANTYAGAGERIIEYTFGPDGKGGSIGGLIIFSYVNGEPTVHLYRHDGEVKITVGKADSVSPIPTNAEIKEAQSGHSST